MNWSLMDCITMGVMLGGAGLPLAIAMARAPNLAYRAAVVLAVGAAFLMLGSASRSVSLASRTMWET